MMSYTGKDQFDFAGVVGERDGRFKVDSGSKAEKREYIAEPETHPGE
jgi:hypothetical protein